MLAICTFDNGLRDNRHAMAVDIFDGVDSSSVGETSDSSVEKCKFNVAKESFLRLLN